jgi:hypothetical protein
LLAPLILLYVLKVRRPQVRVPSVWLWRNAERDLLAKNPFKRLVLQVPLILEILALLSLVAALSGPASRASEIAGEHVAIVVDTSASMTVEARDGRTYMDHARDAAQSVVSRLSPGAAAMIIDAGRDPRIVSPMERDGRRLGAAIKSLRAREVEGRLGLGIALASEQLRRTAGSPRIVVITDGAVADQHAFAHSALPVDVVRIGAPDENAAVVRVEVASAIDPTTRAESIQVFALVANFGTKPRDLFVTLSQRNVPQPLASRRIQLGPGERSPVMLSFRAAPGDAGSGLVVELSPHDGLVADDRGYGRVPPSRRLPVVLAPANASPWLARALGADTEVELMGSTVAALPTAGVPDDALVVIEGACPDSVPGGDLLIINPQVGRCRTAAVVREVQHPSITSWQESDQRLRFLTFDGLDIEKARVVEAEAPQNALVKGREGTLIADVSSAGRTATLVGFDVGESNWPLKASFVLFVRNIVELARAHRAGYGTSPARTGEPLRVRVPLDVTEVELERPDGRRERILARGGLALVSDVDRAGFYYLVWKGTRAGSTLLSANLTSEHESDLRPKKLETAKTVRTRSAAQVADAVTDWSWLLGALALLFIAADVWWVTRKPRLPKQDNERPRRPERMPAEAAE